MKQLIWILPVLVSFHSKATNELYRYTFQEEHMGSNFKIIMYAHDRDTAIQAAEDAYAAVEEVNQSLSDYLTDSEVAMVNRAPAWEKIAISTTLFQVLQKSKEISFLTHGAFDITVGPLVQVWRKARLNQQLSLQPQLDSAFRLVGYQNYELQDTFLIKKEAGMKFDFGAIGKGLAAEKAFKAIQKYGITRVLIDAGGDLKIGDPPPGKTGWKVMIGIFENDNEQHHKMATLSNCGVASSGDLYQYLEIGNIRYSHIVDPNTGLGVTKQLRSTVLGPDASVADALASVFCILPVEKTKEVLQAFPDYRLLLQKKMENDEVATLIGKQLINNTQ